MVLSTVLALVVLSILAVASFFFALAETALFSLGAWQARQLAERSPETGGIVARLLAQPQDLLATLVLGNTLSNAAMVAVGWWTVSATEFPVWPWMAALLAVMLLVCEVAPKTIAVRLPELWALRVIRPVLWLQTLARPVHGLAQRLNDAIRRRWFPQSLTSGGLSDAEYQELLELGWQEGSLAASEREVISQIIRLDRRAAKEVMKPRARMACISDELSVEEMIAAARQHGHRRLPIYDGTPDTVVGVLNTDLLLLDPQVDLADAIEFPSFVPESMNLLQLFKSLQRQKRGLAIVADEYGAAVGVITMEDLLAEIIGPLRRAGEAAGFVKEQVGPGRWRVSGTVRIEDFRRDHPEFEPVAEVETLGGLLVHLLGVVPGAGEAATWSGWRLKAETTDERRVKELTLEALKRREEVADAR